MKARSRVAVANVGFMFLLMIGIAAQAAEVKLLSAEVMQHALTELAGEFESMTGHKLTISYDAAGPIMNRVQRGEIADVAIIQKPMVEALSAQDRVERGSIVILARSGVGLAVRKGAPRPDISSVDAFKRSLLAAGSIAYPDPKRGAASGVLILGIIERLGIAQDVNAKAKLITPPLAKYLSQSEAEIVMTQPAEILAVPSLDLVGWLPDELQDYDAFTWVAGVPSNAKEPDAAKALLQFLTSSAASGVIKRNGMEPGAR